MYAHDPQSCTVDLLSALSGSAIGGFTQFNSNSDISYGPYGAGYLISGVQGGEQAAFADLGTASDLIGRDDCSTVGGGQYFASLHVSEGQVVVVDTCGSSNSCPQTFRNISGLAETLSRTQSSAKALPIPGHIYILRIADGQTTRAMFKLIVVDVGHGNSSVTFRYGILDHRQESRVDCCDESNHNICGYAPRNLILEQGPVGPRGPAPPSAGPIPNPSSAPSPQQPGTSTAEVAGTAAGSVAATLLVVGGVWFCIGRRRSAMGEVDAERALCAVDSPRCHGAGWARPSADPVPTTCNCTLS
ncbi:hypothetical protein FNF31_05168 [Cafeteria roenbergensis]|uniref:Uncharacterized protein n=1 Tax=Cafeteria roenbergensis TaxID=33653 RepID=A0A5A8D0Y2_CAFRO|nr:hypothetical protein FNF31_05168 [Cafeteria roenbergensis]